MKFYGIYKIRRKDNSLIELPILFAFTNDKEIYEDFKSQRNMDMFYVKIKDVDKNFYEKFLKENRSQELSYQELYTKNQFDSSRKTKIRLLSTWKEIETIVLKTDMIYKELMRYITPTVYTLKESFLMDLNVLGYFNVCEFVGCDFPEAIKPLFDGFISYDKEYQNPDIDYDEFALFMFFHGYTFK